MPARSLSKVDFETLAGFRYELRRFLRWARSSRTARRVIASRYIPAP